MSVNTDVLVKLIKDMIGVLKTHTQTLQLDSLEKELNEQEEKLTHLQEENAEDMMNDESGVEEGFEITIHDLSPDYQEFLANSMGYESLKELLTEHEDLNDLILTSFQL